MRKRRNTQQSENSRFISLDQATGRYALGMNTMRRLAQEAGAVTRVGRRVLISVERLDKYLDDLRD